MQVTNNSQGTSGILNSFKGLIEGTEKITFVGTPGFCTPFAELLSFVARDKKLAFIPNLDFDKARSIVNYRALFQIYAHAAKMGRNN